MTTGTVQLKKNLPEVNLLRAVASLMVAAYHLTCGNVNLFEGENFLTRFSRFGYIGVEIFFILSGYVICYALPEFYRLNQSGTFFLKRIIRIEPPYIASIILILLLNAITYKINNTPNDINWWNILGHLAYINNFNGGSYINVIYWTLGIEFQFYLLIGLLFPLIRKSQSALYVLLVLFLLTSCIMMPQGLWVILPYLSYFGIGILLYFYKIRKSVPLIPFVAGILVFLAQIYLFQDLAGFYASLFTIGILLFWKTSNRVINFFSSISFSLYLIHVPVGGRMINLGLRFVHSDASRYGLVALAFVISIAAAWAFYRLIEKPSLMLSKKVLYKQNQSAFNGVDTETSRDFNVAMTSKDQTLAVEKGN